MSAEIRLSLSDTVDVELRYTKLNHAGDDDYGDWQMIFRDSFGGSTVILTTDDDAVMENVISVLEGRHQWILSHRAEAQRHDGV